MNVHILFEEKAFEKQTKIQLFVRNKYHLWKNTCSEYKMQDKHIICTC